MKLSLMIMILFSSSTHPIGMIIYLILATIISTYLLNLTLKSSWFSFIFMLMTLGGMLILFIYVASLAANEKFSYNKLLLFSPICFILPSTPMEMKLLNKPQMALFFEMNNSINTLMAILYLFLSLLVILELISSLKSPLRSWV